MGDEDLTTQVAAPPTIKQNRVQTLNELDTQIKFTLPSAAETGVDLSILTNMLSPQEQVLEKDVLWEYERLFVEVASDLQVEKDRRNMASSDAKEEDDPSK